MTVILLVAIVTSRNSHLFVFNAAKKTLELVAHLIEGYIILQTTSVGSTLQDLKH